MKPDFPERGEITVEWLRKPFGKGNRKTFGAHEVLNYGYMNLPARSLLKDVLDLRDENWRSPMHYVCSWQDAMDATGREFLTPEFLVVSDCDGETPLEVARGEGTLIPWDRFPVRPWVQFSDWLSHFHRATQRDDEAKGFRNPQAEKVHQFIAKVEAVKKLEEERNIEIRD